MKQWAEMGYTSKVVYFANSEQVLICKQILLE